MGFMTVDGIKVEFTNEKNVLAVIRKAGIDVPTLCYKKDLPTFGGCRLCVVEDERGKVFASCSEEPRDGMVIFTNTERLRVYRRMVLELLLTVHNRDCTFCEASGNCRLQALAARYGVRTVPFKNYKEPIHCDFSTPAIIRDPSKCILCGNCVRVCSDHQGIGVLDFIHRGSEATVGIAFEKSLAETNCVNCGQCRVYCPVGAISIHENKDEVFTLLSDPKIRVVAQIAPAVRVAVGDCFGEKNGVSVMGKLVNALHRMGFEEVYDTAFAADLTIMEESAEFINRVKNGGKLPLLTSCCPAWVKFVGDQYPDFIDNVSTCRSPEGMMSAVVKEYYRDPANNTDGRKTVMVSVMPCTAKKMEINRPNSYTEGEKDTDYVLTTTEIVEMIKASGLFWKDLVEDAADIPFGLASGGGVIFGASGGVTEAVLRRLVDGNDAAILDSIANSGVREDSFVREFSVPYNGMTVNICVASGLVEAHQILDQVRSGEKNYHLIEIMACQGGCVNGGGQPKLNEFQSYKSRTKGIYTADKSCVVKKSNENPAVYQLYDGFLKGKEHKLLHNHEFCAK